MKKPLLFLCILLSVFYHHSFAQSIPIDSFYIPGTSWTFYNYYDVWNRYHTEHYSDQYEKMVYTIEKDTIVSGVKFYQLSLSDLGGYKTIDPSPIPVFDFSHGTKDIVGRIRVDSNRVFFTRDAEWGIYEYSDFSFGTEYCIYDFNLALGDTLSGSTITHVDAIDSVMLSNGAYTDRYYCINNPTDNPVTFLRGIGGNYGLIYYGALADGPGVNYWTVGYNGAIMLCYDNPHFSYHFEYPIGTLYGDLQYNCFDMTTLGVNNTTPQASGITIFPNPVKDDLINFEGAELNEVTNATIYDITGKQLYTFPKPFASGSTSLSVPLSPGMYFIKLASPNGIVTKKITHL